jgi:DNA-binding PadR family transcriptional regulator
MKNMNGEKILSEREVRILAALAAGPLSGYAIARSVDEDSLGAVKLSNGTLYPALKRLRQLEAVQDLGLRQGGPGKDKRTWQLTRTGRLMLEWEVAAMRRIVRVIESRI